MSQMDEAIEVVRKSRDLMREADATIVKATKCIEEQKDEITRLRLTVQVQQDHITLLKRGENIPGDGWTQADGEEFFGKVALEMQDAWYKKCMDELKWRLDEDFKEDLGDA